MPRFSLTILTQSGAGARLAEALDAKLEQFFEHDRVTCALEAPTDAAALEQLHGSMSGLDFREIRVRPDAC
jgi:hypothetical protein